MSHDLHTVDCEGDAEKTFAAPSQSREQYILPMKDPDRALLASIRVRSAVRHVGKAIGYKRIADLWGCTESKVSQKIEERDRNYIKPHELLAVMAADTHGVVLAAICSDLGYEEPERKVEPATEAERLLAAARELFSADVVELLQRKAGT